MTIPYPQVLTALKMDSGRQMRGLLEALSLSDQVELATFIGPVRLAYVAAHPEVVDTGVAQNATATSVTLAEISRLAFDAPVAA